MDTGVSSDRANGRMSGEGVLHEWSAGRCEACVNQEYAVCTPRPGAATVSDLYARSESTERRGNKLTTRSDIVPESWEPAGLTAGARCSWAQLNVN